MDDRDLQNVASSGELTEIFIGGVDIEDEVLTKSRIESLGSLGVTVVDAETYNIVSGDVILNVTYTSTGAVTSLTLTTAETVKGRVVVVKDAGGNCATNSITIDTEGTETIDGSATLVLNEDYGSVSLYSDGSNWFIY